MSRTGEFAFEGPLAGRTVAFLEARRSGEVARLVEMQGGTPLVTPALREVPVDDFAPVDRWIDAATAGDFTTVIFLTGGGCQAILDRAAQRGMLPGLLQALDTQRVVARGPKPVRVLKEHQVRIDFAAPEPNTSDELLAAAASWELGGKELGLQVYGGETPFLTRLRAGLATLGARVHEVAPYCWAGPTDTSGILSLIEACTAGRVDALAIFSSSQIHTLFAIAEADNRAEELRRVLNAPHVVVASVGPVTTEAIESHGVRVDVQPAHPKMGHLIMALGATFGGHDPGGHDAGPRSLNTPGAQ
jgi:uroporphyrinogen-III synthase